MNPGSESYNEQYCLAQIKEGNEYYFNLIFEKYRNRLFAYLFKVTKSKETAEEIVLDVFLKLWHGRDVITEIQNLESFLYRVAHNKAIDFFRATKRSPLVQQAVWEVIVAATASESADTTLLQNNLKALLKEAINQLSPQRKKVFELRTYEDLSYAEIARALNLSSNTVRNHLAASVQFIRDYLQKNNGLILLLTLYFGKKP